jgi:heat shock protein HslJ
MYAKLTLPLAALLLLLSACQPQRPTVSTPVTTNSTMTTNQADTRLASTWALRQLNGNPIDTTGMGQHAPYLELNVTDKTVTGHTGCNRLNGTFSTMGRTVHFMPMNTTRMACPGTGNVETEMLGVLQVVDMFQIGDNGELRLYRSNREMAVLQKVN